MTLVRHLAAAKIPGGHASLRDVERLILELDRALRAALMRVNHAGACARKRSTTVKRLRRVTSAPAKRSSKRAREQRGHLAWSSERIRELGGWPSMLSMIVRGAVVSGALALGATAHADAGHTDHSKTQEHWTAPPEMAKRRNPLPADAASVGNQPALRQQR